MDRKSSIFFAKGRVKTFDFGRIKLHAYQNNDFTEKICVILEKDGEAVILDSPIFFDNIHEFQKYISKCNLKIVGKILSCHVGASFLPDVPTYTTKRSYDFYTSGDGREVLEEQGELFGDEVDIEAGKDVWFLAEGSEVELAGIKMNIVRNGDMFDIEIPEIKAIHTHMLCHRTHSIVYNPKHIRILKKRLRRYLVRGYQLFMTSHYAFEGPDDVREDIAYLDALGKASKASNNTASLIQTMKNAFPRYDGDYYLGITAKMLISKKQRKLVSGAK